MAPPHSSPLTSPETKPRPVSSTPSPVPPPVPVETHPNRVAFKPAIGRTTSDPSRLAPEDAYKTTYSPPRLRPLTEIRPLGYADFNGSAAASAAAAALRPAVASLRPPPAIPTAARLEQDRKRNNASKKRRQPKEWKKLLWVKHPTYPDNYTDPQTFLDHLQRNPRLRPYDFWPLVADSTVIVQHVCSVAIFICAYAGIYQDRISPIPIASCGSLCTLAGWVLWEYWMGLSEQQHKPPNKIVDQHIPAETVDDVSSTSSGGSYRPLTMNGHTENRSAKRGLGLTLSTTNLASGFDEQKSSNTSKHAASLSKTSIQSISPIESLNPVSTVEPFPPWQPTPSRPAFFHYSSRILSSSLSPRVQARLKTLKSAILIYFALLGLSPILKSLTKSTSSDSIWALATCLLIINIFFFDYGGIYVPRNAKAAPATTSVRGPAVDTAVVAINDVVRAPPFPSSLSTNAALMASTVLASRLPSTTHVFSLTLFSIEVFGLFPVFRRHLRHESWLGHVLLTTVLITLSSGGMGLILSTSYTHTYGSCGFCWGWIWHAISRSTMGLVIGGMGIVFIMGGCSWRLISLQRYKNVVTGPWDPARPILTHRGRGGTE